MIQRLLNANDIRKRSIQLKGSMARSRNGSFTLYFYSKNKAYVQRCKKINQEDHGIGGKIKEAFQEFNSFNALNKTKKLNFRSGKGRYIYTYIWPG